MIAVLSPFNPFHLDGHLQTYLDTGKHSPPPTPQRSGAILVLSRIHSPFSSDLDYESYLDYETLEERVKQMISEPLALACKIKADHHQQFGEDVLISFMQKQFTWFTEIPHLTTVWAYGRVFITSSGFHGEYLTPDEKILSLLYLGPDEDQVLEPIKKITQQHLYIIELGTLY